MNTQLVKVLLLHPNGQLEFHPPNFFYIDNLVLVSIVYVRILCSGWRKGSKFRNENTIRKIELARFRMVVWCM